MDRLTIHTSHGRQLQIGGGGGGQNKPDYPPRAYVVNVDIYHHDYVTRAHVHYVSLDEFKKHKHQQGDPLVSLISESDLLSRGIEERHMRIFSKDTIDQIKRVQTIVDTQILLPEALQGAAASSSSTDGLSMISTAASKLSVQPMDEEEQDLPVQLIFAGANPLVDDFIKVMQVLLGQTPE